MAALDVGVDTAAVAPVRRRRQLGLLFIAAVAWIALVALGAIFALPGIGRLLVGAIYARDFIILQGVVLFVAVGFVIVNFIVDMLYAVLDPRIRHGRA